MKRPSAHKDLHCIAGAKYPKFQLPSSYTPKCATLGACDSRGHD